MKGCSTRKNLSFLLSCPDILSNLKMTLFSNVGTVNIISFEIKCFFSVAVKTDHGIVRVRKHGVLTL
jgi:hypothetical protein